MTTCGQCPRKCAGVQRSVNFCGKPCNTGLIPFAKSMLHFWEEPCISGDYGSGAIFFAGCNLGCSFCQNQEISRIQDTALRTIRPDQLEIEMFRLKQLGCHNINFVTGSHLVDTLLPVLRHAVAEGLNLPVIWNTSAYETVEQLRSLDSLVDIYLPDLKFYSPALSGDIARAPDYFEVAGNAVMEMLRQQPENHYSSPVSAIDRHSPDTSSKGQTRLIKKGVIIRHLVLPGFYKDSIRILEWIEANLSNHVTLSLMSQYIPDFYIKGEGAADKDINRNTCKDIGENTDKNNAGLPSLRRKLTTLEYDRVVDKAISLGFKDVYTQSAESAKVDYVPDFIT